MLSPELKKLKQQLEAGEKNIMLDSDKLLYELRGLDSVDSILHESLSLLEKVCPMCGRRI